MIVSGHLQFDQFLFRLRSILLPHEEAESILAGTKTDQTGGAHSRS